MAALLDRIAQELGTDQEEARRVLEAVSKAARDELRDGGGIVDLPGLCRLAYRREADREGTNPFTHESVRIPGVGRLKARAAPELSRGRVP